MLKVSWTSICFHDNVGTHVQSNNCHCSSMVFISFFMVSWQFSLCFPHVFPMFSPCLAGWKSQCFELPGAPGFPRVFQSQRPCTSSDRGMGGERCFQEVCVGHMMIRWETAWWFGTCFVSYIGSFIIPSDELLFFKWVGSTTNHIHILPIDYP